MLQRLALKWVRVLHVHVQIQAVLVGQEQGQQAMAVKPVNSTSAPHRPAPPILSTCV